MGLQQILQFSRTIRKGNTKLEQNLRKLSKTEDEFDRYFFANFLLTFVTTFALSHRSDRKFFQFFMFRSYVPATS